MPAFFFLFFWSIIGLVAGEDATRQKPYIPEPVPIFGSIHATAYYFVDLPFGSPLPQRQSLIVDTGSSVMAFGCQDCGSGCGDHLDPKFDREKTESEEKIGCDGGADVQDPCEQCGIMQEYCMVCQRNLRNTSPVFTTDHCAYTIHYLEGSTLNGLWYKDIVWLGHSDTLQGNNTDNVGDSVGIPVQVPFGCHYEETKLFVTQAASGILGLEPESSFGPRPFIKAAMEGLKETAESNGGSIADFPVIGFSLCVSSDGGSMVVGSSHTHHHVTRRTRQLSPDRGLFELPSSPSITVPVPALVPPPRSGEQAKYVTKLNDRHDVPGSAPKRVLPRGRSGRRYLGEEPNNDETVTSGADIKGNLVVEVEDMEPKVVDMDDDKPPEAPTASTASPGLVTDAPLPPAEELTVDDADKIQWVDLLPGDSYHLKVASFGVGAKVFQPVHAKTGQHGMIALLDSGTTLSYLRWIIYAETVLEIDRVVTERISQTKAAKVDDKQGTGASKGGGGQKDGGGALARHNAHVKVPVATLGNDVDDGRIKAPMHLSGSTLSQMKLATDEYLTNITSLIKTSDVVVPENDLQDVLFRHTDEDSPPSDLLFQNKRRLAAQHRELREGLEAHAEEVKAFRRRLEDLEAQTAEGGAKLRGLSRIRDLQGIGRMSAEVKEKFDFIGHNPSARHRTSKEITRMDKYTDEECWALPNGDEDLSNFPKIIITLGEDKQFVWEPSAYLYKKGKSEIRCLAIAPQGIDPTKAQTHQAAEEEDSNGVGALLDMFGHEAVLGSSFFINHDVIFDLQPVLFPNDGNANVPSSASPQYPTKVSGADSSGKSSLGRIGFIEATCPVYDYKTARADFQPQAEALYTKLTSGV